jgi:hypothetical protein
MNLLNKRVAGVSLINNAKKASINMVRAISQITGTLAPLPSQVFVNMKLNYYADSKYIFDQFLKFF